MLERVLESDRGRGRIWSPRAGVFASELEGVLGMQFAEAYIEVGDAVLKHSETVVGVHDWSALTGYDSGVRARVTSWGIRVISRFEVIHVFSQSSVVRMGVVVANMALRGQILVHEDREKFLGIREELLKPGV